MCNKLLTYLRTYLCCRADSQSMLTVVNNDFQSVNGDDAKQKISLEQQQHLTDSDFASNPKQLESELKAKESELNEDKKDEADQLRMKADLERAQLTVDTLCESLDRLSAELNAKEEDIRRKNEEIDQIRVENEALQVAASSSSALIASDYEEQLVSEIERLMFDRSTLQQRLQEAEYEVEETREELTGENDELRRQLGAVRESAEDDNAEAEKAAALLAAENRQLREQLSQREVEFRTAEESLRSAEERLMAENGRLHHELVAASAERSRLSENCAKLENDCVAFQELSNDMVEHCKRLSIELERLRRSSTTATGSDDVSTSHHEHRQRTLQREVQSLRDENTRLTMSLEMERRRKSSTDATIGDRADAAVDLELSEAQSTPAAGNDSRQSQRLKQGVAVHTRGEDGDVGPTAGEKEINSQLLVDAQAARTTALQQCRQQNAERPTQINGEAGIIIIIINLFG